ncbi:MAG: lysophospholipid acyltransferase family protein [Pseudomonadota bacterium]|nr:lysophospholipid acyltransferase family protein [Pseudomonadota bacterium]
MIHLLLRSVRYLVLGLDLVLLTLVIYLLSWLPHGLLRSFYPQLFRFWCRTFVRALGVDLRLHQQNARPLPQTYILIANHPSAFEDIGIPALFPVHSLAKIEVRDWLFAGRISEAAGTLYVRREARDSRREAYDSIVAELEKGCNVALYPEGGCKGRRIFESFRYGAFDISLNTGVPIVPVFLHYEAQEDFEWRPNVLLPKKILEILRSSNRTANYYVFDALDPGDFPDRETYTARVHEMYLDWQRRYLE